MRRCSGSIIEFLQSVRQPPRGEQERGIRRPSCSAGAGQALHCCGKANISARSDAVSGLLAYFGSVSGTSWLLLAISWLLFVTS
jgi:hypothetical protein